MSEKKNIAVAGTGYVGLSVAVLLAQHNCVTAVDVKPERVDMINRGVSPIRDFELEKMLGEGSLDLTATLDARKAYADAEYIVIAVPTNYDSGKGRFDTHCIEDVVRLVVEVNPKAVMIIKSTVPIGYTESLRTQYDLAFGLRLKILFSPEFSREGRSLYDNLYPSRIIVGCQKDYDDEAREFAYLLKEGAVNPDNAPVLIMGENEAEAVKLFANSYLAMRVAFFNELDTFAEMKELNPIPIIEGMCLDERIGMGYNNPSFGYGGYCFPKDTRQLLSNFWGVPNDLIQAIVDSNESRKHFIAWSVTKRIELGDTVGVYRLAMKAGSDNSRESAIWGVLRDLKDMGYRIIVYEPSIEETEDYCGYRITHDLSKFKEESNIILANRTDKELEDVESKVYTRDIYNNN